MSPFVIRTIRHSLNLSCRDFARLIGLTGQNAQDTVARYETGKRHPSIATQKRIKKIAEILIE